MAEDSSFYVVQDYEEHMGKDEQWHFKRNHEPTGICPGCKNEFIKRSARQEYCGNCKKVYDRNRFVIFRRDKFQCAYCGNKSYTGAELHLDHVRPKSDGGEDKAYNLITSCKECNLAKTDALLSSDLEQDILAEIAIRNKREGIVTTTNIKNRGLE